MEEPKTAVQVLINWLMSGAARGTSIRIGWLLWFLSAP
jgi:hypothetical protein